jgi:glycyl-tRNA synthetase beta chain
MSTNTETLLVELLTEELPPKSLQTLGESFGQVLYQHLVERDLVADTFAANANEPIKFFASPRRLAILIKDVYFQAAQKPVKVKLLPASIAFDKDGNASAALVKKLSSLNLSYILQVDKSVWDERMSIESDGKTEILFHTDVASGVMLIDALQNALSLAVSKLPIPKLMSYQLADGLTSVQFVRPVHGLVALHGADVVEVEALGHRAGRTTQGHRFQGAKNITLANASEYETRLEKEGGVIASFEKRRHEIERLLIVHAEQCGDTLGDREDYTALLDEVTALVEMPTVYVGQFEQEFLEVPAECLILTMKLNQKYFPLFHSGDETVGGLSSRFLIVSNMRLDDPRNVIEGNQRVVRPRLSDARFFFETDKKTKLADRLPKLASVVYHNKLGSQGERMQRVRDIAQAICEMMNKDGAFQAKVAEAARLAKADLVADMVGEFPELQGTMGKYYALHEGIDRDVAEAIEDHYKPKFAGDTLPRSQVGMVVALADKLETLAGLFSIGQEPTGDKDPFALRRHALGVIRMLVEHDLPLSVHDLVEAALSQFSVVAEGANARLTTYIFDRLVGYLRELESGYSILEVDAVVTVRPRWGEMPARLQAVRAFATLAEAPSLAAANKRIGNILKKSDATHDGYDKSRCVESAEIALADAMELVIPQASAEFDKQGYTASLKALAALREPVDNFFDKVMVNADDPQVRANRLGLLATLHREMNRVADLSKLAT